MESQSGFGIAETRLEARCACVAVFFFSFDYTKFLTKELL